MNDLYHIELRIGSDPRYLCICRAVIDSALKRLDFSADVRTELILAVDEAISNVMRHGYAGQAEGPIWISFDALPPQGQQSRTGGAVGGVKFVIEDEARQVEPETIRGCDLSAVFPGGLGVNIIQQVMDDVHYQKRAEKGMRLEMVRYTPSVSWAEDASPPRENHGR